jgi:hypothetical protein
MQFVADIPSLFESDLAASEADNAPPPSKRTRVVRLSLGGSLDLKFALVLAADCAASVSLCEAALRCQFLGSVLACMPLVNVLLSGAAQGGTRIHTLRRGLWCGYRGEGLKARWTGASACRCRCSNGARCRRPGERGTLLQVALGFAECLCCSASFTWLLPLLQSDSSPQPTTAGARLAAER